MFIGIIVFEDNDIVIDLFVLIEVSDITVSRGIVKCSLKIVVTPELVDTVS